MVIIMFIFLMLVLICVYVLVDIVVMIGVSVCWALWKSYRGGACVGTKKNRCLFVKKIDGNLSIVTTIWHGICCFW